MKQIRFNKNTISLIFTGILSSLVLNSTAHSSPVQAGSNHSAYLQGAMLGKPSRGIHGGTIFKTNEMHVLTGSFSDNNMYSGVSTAVSAESDQFLTEFNNLDQNKNYVFSFWTPYPFRFYMQSSNFLLTQVSPSSSPAEFARLNIPTELVIREAKHGSYSAGTRRGRIVMVYRKKTYILGRNVCILVLDHGGTNRGSEGRNENEESFMTHSEEGCQYAQDPHALWNGHRS